MHRDLGKLVLFKVIFLMIQYNMTTDDPRIQFNKGEYCVSGILFYVVMIIGVP